MHGFRFLAAAAVVSFAVVGSSARAQKATIEVGFVAAVGDGTLLVSNVPIGTAGATMTMLREGAPPRPPAGGSVPAAAGEAKGGETPATFTFKKADEKATEGGKDGAAGKPGEAAGEGKVITLSREDAEKMKGMWVEADPDAKPAPRTEGADLKVAFTEFHVTADTERPADLVPGTKVKVTYTVEGERKVARKIATVKE